MEEQQLVISVSDPVKQYKTEAGSSRVSSQFVDYKVSSSLNGQTCDVRRRFKDFAFLHGLLEARIPGAIIPTLPAKGVGTQVAQKAGNEQGFLEIRAKALTSYMNILVSNGEAIRESESVRKAVEVFLTGSERAWIDIKDLAKSPNPDKQTSKKGDATNSEAAADGRDRGFSSFGEAAGVKDVGSDDEDEGDDTTEGGSSKPDEPKKSSFGFMSKISMPTMAGIKSMMSVPEKNRSDEKTSDDIKLETISVEVRDQLAKVVEVDRKVNALMNIDRVAFWKAFGEKSGEIAQGFKPKGERSASSSSAAEGAGDEGGGDSSAKGKAALDKAALLLAVQTEGEFTLHPLSVLFTNYANTCASAATGQMERRSLCLEPIVSHIMTLQAVKASLQMRANVRKQWAKTVATHASKKAALQRAYDNPKTSAEYRVEMEQQVDLAKDVMDASEERLNDATKRFGRDYERFLKQKVSTFKEFMFVWAKIHSALANSVSCDLGILHSDISTKCPGGSYLDGGEFKSSEIKVVTAAEAKELFQAQLTAFTTAKEEEAAADKAAKEKLLAEKAAEAAKDLAAKEEAAAKRAEEAAAKAAKEEEEATAAKAKEEEAAAAKAKEEEAAAALEADQAAEAEKTAAAALEAEQAAEAEKTAAAALEAEQAAEAEKTAAAALEAEQAAEAEKTAAAALEAEQAAEAEKTAAAALEAEQAAEAEKTVAATVEPEQAQAEPSATELFPGEIRPSEAAV